MTTRTGRTAQVNSGSFRDPAGIVFDYGGQIYRSILPGGKDDYEAARDSGVYDSLIKDGLLIEHEEVELHDFMPAGTVYCVRHPRIPMISYPWEWPFGLLKQAALLQLEIMERLIPRGLWLRDASALNIQYNGAKPVFIDTLSIGRRIEKSPWVAYGQFCSHFLAPLALAAWTDIRTLALWQSFIDGYPLDLAIKLLSRRKRMRPGILLHLVLHARFQQASGTAEKSATGRLRRFSNVSDAGLLGIIRSLRKTIQGIDWHRVRSQWTDYESIGVYSGKDAAEKATFVENAIKRVGPRMVWDLGANTGKYSRIAAENGSYVVSFDSDRGCTEALFEEVVRKSVRNVLPLHMEIANPSSGLGWANAERMSLKDRGPADMILALALLHHLVFKNSIPLSLIAGWLAYSAPYLVVEFVPPTDPMVLRLTENRVTSHHPYNWDEFQRSFAPHFDFLTQAHLENGRKLLLGSAREGRQERRPVRL